MGRPRESVAIILDVAELPAVSGELASGAPLCELHPCLKVDVSAGAIGPLTSVTVAFTNMSVANHIEDLHRQRP